MPRARQIDILKCIPDLLARRICCEDVKKVSRWGQFVTERTVLPFIVLVATRDFTRQAARAFVRSVVQLLLRLRA